ncbi:hypothetical protein GCM10010339_65910 [Streptomyces alanosinicus]|uniref:Uncharacterized protein n=1 Tax=Streptomyces alanosinicus TaxID=68171 RepID=A0A918YNA7_9ACTN|nr:hypothetical protein GCM10010339_65910 [Streptomyces alanosinicus]
MDQEMAPSDDYLTPVIEFTDRQSRPVRFTPVSTASRMGMDLGTRVPVVYLPEHPKKARVSTRKHRRAWVSMCIGGVIFLGVAVGPCRYRISVPPSRNPVPVVHVLTALNLPPRSVN